ncbi:MAG: GAF domain-containing protein [Cytophagales bacterium]|nr:GAF domain-containing protein [Cytophagales bacterium]
MFLKRFSTANIILLAGGFVSAVIFWICGYLYFSKVHLENELILKNVQYENVQNAFEGLRNKTYKTERESEHFQFTSFEKDLEAVFVREDLSLDVRRSLLSEVRRFASAGGEKSNMTALIGELQLMLMQHKNVEISRLQEEFFTIVLNILWGVAFLSLSATLYVFYILKKRFALNGKIVKFLVRLAEGSHAERLETSTQEFVGVFEACNQLKENLDEASDFALAIGEGKFDYEYKSSSQNDRLARALTLMRRQLKQASEEEGFRNRIHNGIAQLVDITRNNKENFQQLCGRSLAFIIKYCGASQGVLYVLNEEDKLEAQAHYAHGKATELRLTLEAGQGIAGQVLRGKRMIHFEKVPEGFACIASGLGEASPRALLALPFIFNEKLVGVLEIATFHSFGEKELILLQNFAEHLSAEVSSVKNASMTRELLRKSQEQAAHLQSQEEVLRQNVEELEAVQEELERLREEDKSSEAT